ncbi:MAG: UDP-3-O-(3-hydroxymyristoyl)glucosamine N-acyltransferase [Magnetospirillum sp.]|nr:MAG: UDP-3-O-(3-hydroxymyristoyl)glucosamine N-acyltransferase [Magnetospirillum sp.]
MADPRFFPLAGPFDLDRLAAIAGAEIAPGTDPSLVISDVAPLDAAGPGQIAFLDNRKYIAAFAATRASACIVHPDLANRAPMGMALLLSRDPYRAYAMVAQAFHPVSTPTPWIAPTAWVDPLAVVEEGVRVEPGAVIGANARIGAGSCIRANAVIGEGVELGEGCVVGAGATVSHALIGKRVTIYPGARIGQDGFGFAMGPKGHLKVPQLGRVIIGDDCEIGANTTIDRGSGPDTIIGPGCWIDNLVQIGHNVQLGRGCVLVAQVGISGSTRLGDFVAAGGQAGFAGHLSIGSGARIGAQGGVIRDVGPGESVGGTPAVPLNDWLRQSAMLAKMVKKKGGVGK